MRFSWFVQTMGLLIVTAGCGGGGDAPEVARGAMIHASCQTSGTVATGVGTGFSVPCVLSWTNDLGRDVEVQVDALVIVSCTATGTSTGFAASQLRLTDGSIARGYMLLYGAPASAATAAPNQSGSVVRQVTVPNGGTITATLRVNAEFAAGVGLVTATWEDANLRFTLIDH